MPDPYKVTWYFEGVQPSFGTTASAAVGWTETWYQNFDSVEAALIEARRVDAVSYLGTRLPCLAPLYRCSWIRASNQTNPRISKVCSLPPAAGGQAGRIQPVEAVPNGAQITCALLVDFFALDAGNPPRAHHRRFLLRGLMPSLINGNIINEAGVSWNNVLAFLTYVGQVRAPRPAGIVRFSNWSIRISTPGSVYQQITALALDTNPQQIVISATVGNLIRGDKIAIRKVGFPRGANRIWTALQGVNNTGVGILLGKAKRPLAGAWDNTGEALKLTYAYILPTQYTVVGLRTRKIGVPFHLTRGRRRGV